MNMNKSLPEKTANEIIDYTNKNNLLSGDKIPSEQNLSEFLGVSRSTLREAIRLLISRNILEIRHSAGTFISNNTGVNSDKDKYKLAKELFEIRIIIEPEIAMMSALNATDSELEEIKKLCSEIEKKIESKENHIDLDKQFHELIAKSSGNEVIGKLIPIILSSIEIFGELTDLQLTEETVKTHRELTKALINRNPIDAKHFMSLHLLYNKNLIG